MYYKYWNEGEKIFIWIKLKRSVARAARNLKIDKNKRKNSWFYKEFQNIVNKRKATRQIRIQNLTQDNINNYTKTKATANKIIRKDKKLSEKK